MKLIFRFGAAVAAGLAIGVVIGLLEFYSWCQREGVVVGLDGSLVGVRSPSIPWFAYAAFATLGALALLVVRGRSVRGSALAARSVLAGGLVGVLLAAGLGTRLNDDVLDYPLVLQGLHMASRTGVLYVLTGGVLAAFVIARGRGPAGEGDLG